MSETAKVFIVHASDSVKDFSLNYCVASGEEDIFLDVETVEDRIEDVEDSQELKELKELIEFAKVEDAEYIHLF